MRGWGRWCRLELLHLMRLRLRLCGHDIGQHYDRAVKLLRLQLKLLLLLRHHLVALTDGIPKHTVISGGCGWLRVQCGPW